MHIITRRHLLAAAEQFPDTASELAAWFAIVRAARWKNFLEVRSQFPDADAVDEYVVFNIRHNRYRLLTIIHDARQREGMLTQGHVYVRSFLTHRQYDKRTNWDKGVRR